MSELVGMDSDSDTLGHSRRQCGRCSRHFRTLVHVHVQRLDPCRAEWRVVEGVEPPHRDGVLAAIYGFPAAYCPVLTWISSVRAPVSSSVSSTFPTPAA